MKITEAEIAYVASLAALDVADSEKAELADQLTRILDFVEKLNQLDVSGIEPTPQVVTGAKRPLRDDRAAPRPGSAEAGKTVRFFKVPKVITER